MLGSDRGTVFTPPLIKYSKAKGLFYLKGVEREAIFPIILQSQTQVVLLTPLFGGTEIPLSSVLSEVGYSALLLISVNNSLSQCSLIPPFFAGSLSHSECSSPSLITPPQSPLNLETSSFASSQSQGSISTLPRISVSPVPIGERRKDRYSALLPPRSSLLLA